MAKDTRLRPPEVIKLKAATITLVLAAEGLIRALDGQMTIDDGKPLDLSIEVLFARLKLEELVREFRKLGFFNDSI